MQRRKRGRLTSLELANSLLRVRVFRFVRARACAWRWLQKCTPQVPGATCRFFTRTESGKLPIVGPKMPRAAKWIIREGERGGKFNVGGGGGG